MSIKGLTDQPRQFCEIGQLRKGAPKPKGKPQPGADLTYFRATFEPGEERAADMFLAEYGPEPDEINIRLPFNTVDENFDAWKEVYVQSGLIHRCDGEYVQYAVDPQTGTVLVRNGEDVNGNKVKCDGKPVTWYTDKKGQEQPVFCRPTGRLKVIVPELRRLAFMTVLTTSIWDVLNISRQLEAIRYVNDGKLQNVPLVLKRRPREISTPSGTAGKKARREKWLVSIEADPNWVAAQILALPEFDEPLQLPPGMPDMNGDEEIVEAESQLIDQSEEEMKSDDIKSSSEPKSKVAMWIHFLKEADIKKQEALKLLGADSVNEWVRQDKSRRLEDAIEEIKKVLAFLNEYDITLTKAEKILGSDLKGWRQSNSTRAIQDAIDEIVAVGGLTKPAQ